MSIQKTDMIYLRVTPQERKRIEEKMAELGIHNISAYIRKMALDGLCICLDLKDIRSLTEQVARCGNNLKQTAKTLLFLQQHDIHSYEDLERMTNEAVTGADQLLASIKEKDARIKEIEALRQHIFDYSKTRKIYLEYKRLPKAKKAEFYELHRAEIELQEAARTAFDQLPEGTKLPTVKELNAERTRLIQERQAEYAEYRKVKADRAEFIRAKQNADVILNRQDAERADQNRTK